MAEQHHGRHYTNKIGRDEKLVKKKASLEWIKK
jgi:hypothetical protein